MSGAGGVYKPASEGLSKYFMCMLDDEDRNSKYRAGIAACFAEFAAENGGEMPTVLDIGVGTGMLSALCLEAGAKHVTAVDCNETMCNLARRHLKELAQKSRFEVVQAHAGKPPPFEAERRFDVVVSEILGTLTTSESMCKYVSIYAPHIRRFGADGRKVYMVPRRTEQKLALHAFQRAALGEPLASLLLDAVGTGKLTPTNEGGLNLNLHLYPSTQVPGSCHVIHEEDYSRAAADPAAKGCAFEVKSSLEPQLVDVSAVDGRTELLLGLLEWEVTLWDGVVMRNSLEGYRAMAGHDGSPPVRTAAARGSAWGFFAVGVPQPPRHYIKLRAYAANPMSRSIPELAVDGEKTAAAVDEESRQYLAMAADVELHRAFEAAIAHAARKGDRLLVVNDISCGRLPMYAAAVLGCEVDVVTEETKLAAAVEKTLGPYVGAVVGAGGGRIKSYNFGKMAAAGDARASRQQFKPTKARRRPARPPARSPARPPG